MFVTCESDRNCDDGILTRFSTRPRLYAIVESYSDATLVNVTNDRLGFLVDSSRTLSEFLKDHFPGLLLSTLLRRLQNRWV